MYISSFCMGRLSKRGLVRYKSLQGLDALFRPLKGLPQDLLKKDRQWSVEQDIKMMRATTSPINFWSSLGLIGGAKRRIALIFSRLASMLRLETMNPRNFPEDMLKAHLVGLASSYSS